jgi:hypothetical protein
MIWAVRRFFLWLLLIGGIGVVLGVLWQAFTIAAYVRGAGDGALDAHLTGSFFVHPTQLAIVIGAIGAFWGRWLAVVGAIGFLVLCVAQLAFLGDIDKQGGWINGLHGLLALVILLCGVAYASSARRELGLGTPAATG